MSKVHSELEIGAELGKGHFGVVYAGTHGVHGDVAVKKLVKLPLESHTEWQQRVTDLKAEGRNLKSAEHERVVRVIDLVDVPDEDAVLLVLELCRGGSLQTAFENGPLRIDLLRRHLTDVALGLQVVHARSLIHRDIKPANILCDAAGRAKVADFGLVTDRLVVGYASAAGYADHLAIEVWENGFTNIRTDVWAFGMTAYRLLHGATFYNKLLPPRFTVEDGDFAKRLPWLPHVPKKWRRFVRQAMHDNTADRYQDMGEVLSALSTLPIAPAWACSYAETLVTWERTKGDRKIEVEWRRLSARRHQWTARSSPMGAGGHARTLKGSAGIVGEAVAVGGLERFFAEQTP